MQNEASIPDICSLRVRHLIFHLNAFFSLGIVQYGFYLALIESFEHHLCTLTQGVRLVLAESFIPVLLESFRTRSFLGVPTVSTVAPFNEQFPTYPPNRQVWQSHISYLHLLPVLVSPLAAPQSRLHGVIVTAESL
jgi:hypothetical protein